MEIFFLRIRGTPFKNKDDARLHNPPPPPPLPLFFFLMITPLFFFFEPFRISPPPRVRDPPICVTSGMFFFPSRTLQQSIFSCFGKDLALCFFPFFVNPPSFFFCQLRSPLFPPNSPSSPPRKEKCEGYWGKRPPL